MQVLVGIESLVFRYPGMGAKQAELGRIVAVVSAIQDSGVEVNGCFIVNAGGDTQDSVDRMVKFISESPLAEVHLTLQALFPRTDLYEQLRIENRILMDKDWSFYSLFDVVFRPDRMTVSWLEQACYRSIEATFQPGECQRRDTLRRSIWANHPKRITRVR